MDPKHFDGELWLKIRPLNEFSSFISEERENVGTLNYTGRIVKIPWTSRTKPFRLKVYRGRARKLQSISCNERRYVFRSKNQRLSARRSAMERNSVVKRGTENRRYSPVEEDTNLACSEL